VFAARPAATWSTELFAFTAPADDVDFFVFADKFAAFAAFLIAATEAAATPVAGDGPAGNSRNYNEEREDELVDLISHDRFP
jgi:hypothetical protein